MRRVLRDTHVLLGWLADDSRLGPTARALIGDDRNIVYISAASAWEASIRKAMGRLTCPDNLDSVVQDEGFEQLPISFLHGESAGALPRLHRDPFDRMLVAQAQAEGLGIVTGDDAIRRYAVRTIDASG